VGCILAPLRGWAARLPLVTARLKTCPDTTEHEPKRVSQQKAKAAALEPPLCLLVTFLPVTASNYGTDWRGRWVGLDESDPRFFVGLLRAVSRFGTAW